MVLRGQPLTTFAHGMGDTPQAARTLSVVQTLTLAARARYHHLTTAEAALVASLLTRDLM